MGRRACCAKEGVKRGAWTSKEDDILASYVKAHGEGRWREVPHKAGTYYCLSILLVTEEHSHSSHSVES
jgi:myb proto-oncogene protein